MKKVLLSKDIQVSSVCLGAMNFGTTTSREAAFRVLDAYVDAGGNFIDTSNNYAHWAGTGDESEMLLGEWFRERGCRDKIVLATKVGFDRHGEGAGLRREQIEYWIDESLRKMGTDYIDLYYAHTDDSSTPLWPPPPQPANAGMTKVQQRRATMIRDKIFFIVFLPP